MLKKLAYFSFKDLGLDKLIVLEKPTASNGRYKLVRAKLSRKYT